MKKNFLLAMFVMLMTSISSFAQDQKEYNMVITLNNGTTVTLGHNDIKEITFNDGAVSISGNVINTIDQHSDAIEQLNEKVKLSYNDNRTYIDATRATIEEVQAETNKAIDNCAADITANKNLIQEVNAKSEAYDKDIITDLTATQDRIRLLEDNVAVQNDEIQQLKAYIQILKDQVDQLNAKIDNK